MTSDRYGSTEEDPLLEGSLRSITGTTVTAQDAIKKGDHNSISLAIVYLLQCHLPLCQAVAPFLAELFGTMMLTLVIALSSDEVLAPLAIGSMLMCVIFTYGHLSGAHYNPAVSLAVYLRGHITFWTLIGYVLFQVAGAVCATTIAQYIFDQHLDASVPLPSPSVGYTKAFLLEAVFTYTLCTTVLNTATTASVGPNSFYGLAIGFVVMSGAVASGGYSGAVFNPAVACGLFYANSTTAGLGLYWAAPMAGGFLSGVLFHVMNSKDSSTVKFDSC